MHILCFFGGPIIGSNVKLYLMASAILRVKGLQTRGGPPDTHPEGKTTSNRVEPWYRQPS